MAVCLNHRIADLNVLSWAFSLPSKLKVGFSKVKQGPDGSFMAEGNGLAPEE